jgi:antitoxin VapB
MVDTCARGLRISAPVEKADNLLGKTVKLFKHGRSQAVRQPKEFRFEGSEVRVSRIGDKVILEPMRKPPFDVAAWRAKLRAMGAQDFLPDGLPDEPPLGPEDDISLD